MTSKDTSLYGIQRPKHGSSQKDITSSSTLAFTSQLSSLISKDVASTRSSSTSNPTKDSDYKFARGRARPSKSSKPDLFAVHNKGTLKRAAKDEAAGEEYDAFSTRTSKQIHQNSDTIGTVDAFTLQRSKRRMEEKADLYKNLRKGHHLADGSSSDEAEGGDGDAYMSRLRRKERNALVDFDRKWAEDEEKQALDKDEDDDDDNDDGIGPMVDYEDEFGRTRRGTRAEAAQAARLRRQAQGSTAVSEEDRSRPSRPTNLIYGETVQTYAFNPDAAIASQMAYLASKRDRSATPPESLHYDAEAEVRTRGTGFYKFSKDGKEREQEMHDLLNVRVETEREREERGRRKVERDRVKDERRAKIRELRGKRQADKFLDGLGVPV
ncbi:hypothetical protein EYB25_001723 [Talaromyces marneffei]|uniref:Uncharacterized protein n=2 Tax=Talaromyces marneffei TaxID=37727 RepID=B6Q4L2_TALMQ|nr:uncharacterized protein EYB26_000611 [Talaromyces marneffei]EEA27271.1 conserved hypothetical protein [Talaromyces marneffei ATCC 18224]KAE8557017.1 hypothetical protein EYB25_001723 [Talaromyces marneffei]QGA12966.1 hypothetical protein EYB26_000611 [Talaromyces marneffei]